MDRKWCYRFPYELVDNLNIAFNQTNGILVFWTKFQIFLMNKQDFDKLKEQPNWHIVYHFTDFEIHKLLLADHLFCLDNEGSLRSYALNLQQTEESAHKKPKLDFQILDINILCIECFDDLLLSIKSEKEELLLQIHKIKSTDATVCNSNKITVKDLLLSQIKRDNCIILCCFSIDESHLDIVKQLFRKTKSLQNKYFIIVVTFDKLTLYAILVDLTLNNKVMELVKFLTCPSEINSVTFLKESELNLIVSLSAGTVIKQSLNNNSKTPKIAHLNTAIHKCAVLNEKLIYTDGITMWVSTNTFSEHDVKLRQLFVKNVKDFKPIENSGRIICTTYSKLIYVFNVKNESSFLISVPESEYHSVEHLFNNMKYLDRIMEEVEKNDKIIKNIENEENYITALALSNRQDIMDEMIQCCVSVYERYEDILTEGLVLYLTNSLPDYFKRGSFYILIKLSASLHENFVNILANIFTDSNILITILSGQKVIKTISIKVMGQLKIYNIVVPLVIDNTNKLSEVILDIKIIKKIPKVLNCKQNLWTAVYCKPITLTPEHFIESNFPDTVKFLKDTEVSIPNLLYKAAHKHHGHIFRITKASDDLLTMQFYTKLPNIYREILQNEIVYKEHFKNSTKAKFLLKELSTEEFLNSIKNITFSIFNEKLYVEIINHGFSNNLSSKMLKVSCVNPVLALQIRNFFSNLMHNYYRGDYDDQKFINFSLINSSLEKIEKSVKKIIDEKLSFEDFLKIYEQFQIRLCSFSIAN